MALGLACWVAAALAYPDKAPEETAKSLKGPAGFEFTVFAAEPMVVNPTNMEVDSRGRVWVTEGLNYRFFANKNFQRVPGADKIKVLEDTDGDGRADKVTVFAENIYPVPMGLAVQEIWKEGKYAGCRVFTGNSPDLLVFEDTNGDDKADKREVLLTGFGGHDSDHGVHGMFLGPDGLLYFTQGDGRYGGGGGPKLPPGATMRVVGKDGRVVESHKDGTVLRCNLDGTGLELVATGLRNNYEVTVDSFGRIFASDNDDDGNRGCRMCWILPGAHYGYKTPGSPRHWGEENPANTPKLVGTGNGSPCGIMVYEGDLLPPEVRGAVLQVDAGTRQINLHPLTKVGASLRTEYKVLVKGDDPQFRPVDCCTAPDGSLVIADWYDAGVGGHRFTDQKTGRVYRLAPKGMKYERPKVDWKTPLELLKAMGSPNVTTSFSARDVIKELNDLGMLDEAYYEAAHKAKPNVQARLFQRRASNHPCPNNEVLHRFYQRRFALADTHVGVAKNVDGYFLSTVSDLGAPLEALLTYKTESQCWPTIKYLATSWDGSDRFYLQAIRIGCSNLSSAAKTELFEALLDDALKAKATNDNFALPPYYPTGSNEAYPLPTDPIPPTDARGKLIGVAWVLEAVEALPALQRLASERPSEQVQRGVLTALARFRDPKAADAVFAQLSGKGDPFQRGAMLQLLGERLRSDWKSLANDGRTATAFQAALADAELRLTAVRTVPAALVQRDQRLRAKVVAYLHDQNQDMAVRQAALAMLVANRDAEASTFLTEELKRMLGAETASPLALAGVSGLLASTQRNNAEMNWLFSIVRETKYPVELRRCAVQRLAADQAVAKELLRQHQSKPLPEDVLAEARYFLNNHANASVRNEAAKLLPAPKAVGRTMDVRRLVNSRGDAEKGRAVFFADGPQACGKCHRVQGVGQWVGPDLSAIGEKYPKPELFYHIVQPSGAIAFGYQNWHVELKDGRILNGLIVEESPERFVLRTAAGDRVVVPSGDAETRRAVPTSLMPEKLADPLKDEEVVDLLEFLSSLRQPVVEAAEYLVSSPMDAGKLTAVNKPTKESGAGWRKLVAGRDGVVDLSGLLKSQQGAPGVAVYLAAESPTAQQAELVLSTAVPAKVSVNGADVPTTPGKHGGLVARVELKQGANDVLLRLSSGVDRPTLTTAFIAKRPVRLTSPAGN